MTKYLIHSLVFIRLIYRGSFLSNLPVIPMFKLERIQRRFIHVLYKIIYASEVSISTLMR